MCTSPLWSTEVRSFYEAALRAGGARQRRRRHASALSAGYYSAFVLDPDGHNVEAACHAPGDVTFFQDTRGGTA